MRKNYNAPQTFVVTMDADSLLTQTSYIPVGGWGKPRIRRRVVEDSMEESDVLDAENDL